MPVKTKTNELKIIRTFDAPVRAVWEAFTDVEKLSHWWGPRGFTITTYSKDLRPGGTWVYTMHGPDGTDYPNFTRYLEIEQYVRLVYDHGAASSDAKPMFRVTVLFEEAAGKTTMDMTMTLATAEAAEETRQFIKKVGGNSTWDRLAEYLTKESSGKEKFVLARSFEAPIERIFEMWTNPEHLSRWLPPAGQQMQIIRGEIRQGGKTFWRMHGSNRQFCGQIEYLQIEKPNRLVYVQQFCDEQERISRHPFAPTWPEKMLTTVDFTTEGPEQTRVRVTWEPYGPTTTEEVATFVKERSGMTLGWTGSFDKLEALAEQGVESL